MSKFSKNVTDASFEKDVLKKAGLVLMDFWAPWCGPCKMMHPALEELADDFAGQLTVAKVNIEDNPKLLNRFMVRGLPTLVLFKDGKQIADNVGSLSYYKLHDWITHSQN
jgi:thioredoxin 1